MSELMTVKDNVYTHVGYKKLKGQLSNGSKTLFEMFLNRVKNSPDVKMFGTINEEKKVDYIDYKTLDTRAKKLGVFLESITSERDIVGIASVSRVEWLVAEYASYYANCANSPVYTTLTATTLASLIEMTKMNVIVVSKESVRMIVETVFGLCKSHKFKHLILMDDSKEMVDECRRRGIEVHLLSEILSNGKADAVPKRSAPKPSDIASICFTSGTGGSPKGVELMHSNFIAQIEGFEIGSADYDIVQIEDTDVYISYLPLAHVFERICVCICIHKCCKIGFYRGLRDKIGEDYRIVRPTFVTAVPKVLKTFCDTIEKKVMEKRWYQRAIFRFGMAYKIFMQRFGIYKSWLWDPLLFGKIANLFGGRIRACLCGGSMVNEDLLRYMQAILSINIFQGYGQTEGLGANILNTMKSTDVASVGVPFISTEIKLENLSDDYPANHKRLMMRGPAVSLGYFGEKKRSLSDWLDTGDICKVENGCIYILGRYKDLMKLGNGEYIAPEILENLVLDRVKDIDNIHITIKPGQMDLVAVVACEDMERDKISIIRSIQNAVKALVSEGEVSRFVSIHHFVIIRQEFSKVESESGLVTASMKKKRLLIDSHFKNEIEEAYSVRY